MADNNKKPSEDNINSEKSDEQITEPKTVQPTSDSAVTSQSTPKKTSFWQKYKANKKVSIPLTLLAVVLLILLIPFTRYKVLGLFISKQFSVSVVDSTTNQPVTSAEVSLDGKTVETDSSGKATIKSAVGNQTLTVKKNYYQDYSQKVTVPLSSVKDAFEVKLQATGRQVPITVTNKISGQGINSALIKAADTEARTDKDGKTTIVLPVDKSNVEATVSAPGYNDSKSTIKVTDQADKANNLKLTPSGKVYFLSKASGKINVVKTNLDGTARQTVLAGTGKEEEAGTVLLASRDWKYLVLQARRDSKLAKLYLINTANDKLSVMDEGDANFGLVGWHDHYFVYTVNRNNVKSWRSNGASIKSFNAEADKIITLDSTTATGSDEFNAQFESYGSTNLVGDLIVYDKTWYSGDGYLGASGKKNTLVSIQPDGANKKTISTIDSTVAYFGSIIQSEPVELYISVSKINGGESYYVYKSDGSYTQSSKLISEDFNKPYPTYLLSPGDTQTFWDEPRDGKHTLFVGNKEGENGKQVDTLSPYSVYGWYTDNYLLVSKDGSELYILPKSGGKAIKITDYHKPDRLFYGYGGGYGGL